MSLYIWISTSTSNAEVSNFVESNYGKKFHINTNDGMLTILENFKNPPVLWPTRIIRQITNCSDAGNKITFVTVPAIHEFLEIEDESFINNRSLQVVKYLIDNLEVNEKSPTSAAYKLALEQDLITKSEYNESKLFYGSLWGISPWVYNNRKNFTTPDSCDKIIKEPDIPVEVKEVELLRITDPFFGDVDIRCPECNVFLGEISTTSWSQFNLSKTKYCQNCGVKFKEKKNNE